MPTFEIDGKTLEADNGTMIIKAADDAGIYIPRFCYHEKLSIAANCRMCLVEVEKAPKPLPACATPVAEGMKISTRSGYARDAQRATMEFLLINHPLDCPVCDQGGECPLQDQAMAFGRSVSRFTEGKRAVDDSDIGPLIETEMTRCIHCTRCVRFGQEVAGIMELGTLGRGEHMEIGTFLGRSVDSELSGNVIDLCPVGALTSKPARFNSRSWELINHDSIAVHDCLGSNINIQSIREKVRRVLPRTNEGINECWLSDRDRFSYEALNSPARLRAPMIRHKGAWEETDWETALRFAADGLNDIAHHHGAGQIGGLAAPGSTVEEFHLFQKFMRSLGSPNVDHRLRQRDFRNDDIAPAQPSLGLPIAELENAAAILLVGSNIRKEQPLLGLRVYKAWKRGARIMAINPMDYDFRFDCTFKQIGQPAGMVASLARVAGALQGKGVDEAVKDYAGDAASTIEQGIAATLEEAGGKACILLGDAALNVDDASVVASLSQQLGEACGATVGVLPPANSVGGWVAGCVPHRGSAGEPEPGAAGLNARAMLEQGLRAYVLLGNEPELDTGDPKTAREALSGADLVVAITPFDVRGSGNVDVMLPATPWSEMEGTFINCAGVQQTFAPAVAPFEEARPAWKILRVLGNFCSLDGFDQVSVSDVRAEVAYTPQNPAWGLALKRWNEVTARRVDNDVDLARIRDVPPLRIDGTVRRAESLQQTRDNPPPAVAVNSDQAARFELTEGETVQVHAANDMTRLTVVLDERVPAGCVYIPSGFAETVILGAADAVRLVRAG
ncbi:MAG: NADH-quinone oxidoreductase subunit NuoG [Gammaproteobacteria bacterium]|nr:NADH-quinone oxidoreductase subunit NuoG [Gammaproteobacteria bacterium]